jgi:uncharacterized protein (DUF427 family)
MSLTLGPAPLGNRPAGIYNGGVPGWEGLLYLEPSPRRIRGLAAGETVVDSAHAQMLYEHGRLPIYMFPREEVRDELLLPSEHQTASSNKGRARWWDLVLGERRVPVAAWEYAAPPPGAPPLAGLVAFKWEALDEWFEEDEPAIVHARDPYHRVDVLETSRHVRITLEDELLVDTGRARVIFETALPPRWYAPREDIRADLSVSPTRSGCAYKGYASYHSLRTGTRIEPDIAWTYEEPRREVAPIAGMIAFFNERVDIELDGERQDRPLTPWSPNWPGPRSEGPPVISG